MAHFGFYNPSCVSKADGGCGGRDRNRCECLTNIYCLPMLNRIVFELGVWDPMRRGRVIRQQAF